MLQVAHSLPHLVARCAQHLKDLVDEPNLYRNEKYKYEK